MDTLRWVGDALELIDQRGLPTQVRMDRCATVGEVARAIRELRVRGAPAIGVAAAYGLALGGLHARASTLPEFVSVVRCDADNLAATRPTAVNLRWALDRTMRALDEATDVDHGRALLLRAAQELHCEDEQNCRAIGAYGAPLIPPGSRVLTHCNAGALATTGIGTALGVIRAAYGAGRIREVLVDETRPVLQGARLTAWELAQDGIPATLITDNAAAHFMKLGRVDVVVVGADRITARGDVANKIGTYGVALAARAHGLPFYVAAPLGTVDFSLTDGDAIPIEERSSDEVTTLGGVRIAPHGIAVENPAFDVTPARFIAGIITERGVALPDFAESLSRLRAGETLPGPVIVPA
ncbi:MAG: S-methyl-5-thioribose-1-phosphate isomerase [Chloroflexi bacterium]|nr:S-methyl-5-thioribose-1-phosphate isomerase [Chloroflexota bacterium]